MANKKSEAKEAEVKEEVKAKKEVVFNKNVKYGDTPIEAGVKTQINEEDFDELVEAGVIEE
jgi:hypothetical protein